MTPPAAAAAPAVRPRRAPAPLGPRRVSGPARPSRAPRRTGAARAGSVRPGSASVGGAGLVVGLLSALESLAQHRLLDRLIRGRVWIGLVAFALIGIVTLQLGLLKLNGGIGRALEHEALLQRENAALSIENSELAAGTRVEQGAAKLGMAFVPTGALRFLSSDGRADAAKAATALASAAHAAAQAREASTAEASASAGAEAGTGSGETSEAEASGEAASTGEAQASGEGSAAASESSGSSEEASSGEASASSEASSGESAAAQATGAGEAEPSGGSAAGATGG